MTALYPGALTEFIAGHDFGYVSATAGIVAIALLVALLIEKELLRAAGGAERANGTDVAGVDAAIIPLLIVFAAVVVARFFEILL